MHRLNLSNLVGSFGIAAAFALTGFGIVNAAPGSLDPAFGTSGKVITSFGSLHDYGLSVAIQGDGKILTAGYASNGSDFDFALTRSNTDGSLDSGFGTAGKVLTPIGAGDDFGRCLALQADGRIVVVGSSIKDVALVRYNPDGTLDASFGVAGKVVASIGSQTNVVNGVVVQSDGRIVVAGYCAVGGNYDVLLVRFNSDGSLDSGFGTNGAVTSPIGAGNDYGMSAALQSDGKIVVGGYAKVGSSYEFGLLRFTADGVLDGGFGTGGSVTTSFGTPEDHGYGVVVQPDGKIVLAGKAWTYLALARYTADGVLDGSFGIGGRATANSGATDFGRAGSAVAVRSDGKIFVAGSGSDLVPGFAVVSFESNGVLDNSFGAGGTSVTKIGTSDKATAVALQDDGKIVVAGYSWSGTNWDFALLRYDGGAVAALPEIGVRGGAGDIVDGDTSPSMADNTNFGNAPPSGQSLTRTFTITNSGTAPLVLSGAASNFVTLSGSNAFRISKQPVSGTVTADGGTATFTIAFDPAAVGEVQATVSIASNDRDENPFNFVISATGMLPEIALSGNGTNIVRGDTLPSNTDHTDFGTMSANEGRVKRAFTISNSGGNPLHLSATAPGYVILSGSGAFQVTRQPASNVVAPRGGITTFEVTFDPNSVGIHAATVNIPSDDLDEKPFTFSIQGTGKLPLAGDLDLSFNVTGKVSTPVGAGNEFGRSVVVQADDRILVAGPSFNGGSFDFALLRYNADGTQDSGFGTLGKVITAMGDGDDNAWGVALQGDGKIVVAGSADRGGSLDMALARYNSDGTLDNDFGAGGKVITSIGGGDDVAYDVEVRGDGRIMVVGYSFNGADDDMAIVCYNPDGSLDSDFGTGGKLIADLGGTDDYAESVAIQDDGKVVVAGSSFNGNNWSIALARCSSRGSLDSTFSGDGTVTTGKAASHWYGFSVALQSDGKLVVTGEGFARGSFIVVQRYNQDGTLDSGFGTGGWVTTSLTTNSGGATGVVLQDDGKIVVSGYAGGFILARYTSTGVRDKSFGNSGIVTTSFDTGTAYAEGLAMQSDGRIVAAGSSFNGTDYDFALARYESIRISRIHLMGRAVGIENGDTTPRPEDNTDFGNVDFTGGSVRRAFDIVNYGTTALNLTGTPRVTLSGSSAFSVTSQPTSSSIASGARIGFEISYDPASSGNDQAIVSIANDDSTVTPFTFGIAGKRLTPLENWRLRWFGTAENTGSAADGADFDGDGVVNLMEWACNLDPTSCMSVPASLEHKGTKLEFTYARSVAAVNSGVNYAVQWCDVLQSPGSWDNGGVTQQIISDNGIVQVVRASVPAESPRRFVRLQVISPP